MRYLKQSTSFSIQMHFHTLLFALVTQLANAEAIFTMDDCKAISSNFYCQCSKELARFEIECASPKSSGKFNLYIGPGKSVKIECDDIKEDEYEILPTLEIGQSKIVQIQYCPLPENRPIAELLAHLGISRVNYLTLAISEQSTNIKQQHLVGLKDLQHLKLSSKSLNRLPDNLFQDLSNLVWLDLRSNNFTLSEKLFESLTNLTFLDLGHNFLDRLPEGVFKNQQQLQRLNLWSNRLQSLDKEVFRGISSLTMLDLSSNEIETLNLDVFSLLSNLRSLDLNMNRIRELPMELFATNKQLTEFMLINNRVPLQSLPGGLFANLPHLEKVRLSCGLKQVPLNLFANSTQLANLTMNYNMLKALPEGLLKDQYNLYGLDLSHNRLQILPEGLFENTKHLVELRLSHNQLKEVSSKLLNPLVNLELLQLDNNNLVSISFDAFRDTENLKFLNLKNNKIDLANDDGLVDDSSSPFRYLFKLQELNLRNNSIMYLHKDMKTQLLALRKLDLSYNNIRAFADNDLRFLSKNVIQVNLTHNLIEEIDFNNINSMDFANDAHPILIDLNDNPLYCDCMLLPFLQYVFGELKDKIGNKIQLLTNNLRCDGPPALREKEVIDLSYMELVCPLDDQLAQDKQCPRDCECLVRPFDLMLLMNCSHGNMMHLPTLPIVPILRGIELNVEHNKLVSLPLNNTPGYADVMALYAAGNQLQRIEVSNLPKNLEYLDVRHNLLQHLNASVLNFLNSSSNIQAIFLAHNPWICDCKAQPLVEFTRSVTMRQKLAAHDFRHMRCTVKEANKISTFKFADIAGSKACTSQQNLFGIIAMTVALILLVIGICATLYQKYKKSLHLYMQQHNMCLFCLGTSKEGDADFQYDVFVSYAHLDEHIIVEQLIPELENGPVPFRLCLYQRDWNVDECFTQQLVRSVSKSHRTIVFLSQNFVKSWADMEFRIAHKSALASRRNRLIVVVYSDMNNIESLDKELKALLKTNTYIKWGEPLFWNNLRAALQQGTCAERFSLA